VSDWLKPSWEPLWLRCGPCKHEWDSLQPCHCPIPTWVAHVRSLRCPLCGAKKLLIRMTPLAEASVADEAP
jgi:hypothetical protein